MFWLISRTLSSRMLLKQVGMALFSEKIWVKYSLRSGRIWSALNHAILCTVFLHHWQNIRLIWAPWSKTQQMPQSRWNIWCMPSIKLWHTHQILQITQHLLLRLSFRKKRFLPGLHTYHACSMQTPSYSRKICCRNASWRRRNARMGRSFFQRKLACLWSDQQPYSRWNIHHPVQRKRLQWLYHWQRDLPGQTLHHTEHESQCDCNGCRKLTCIRCFFVSECKTV